MKRPLTQYRPIGPFAQDTTELMITAVLNKDIKSFDEDTVEDIVVSFLQANGITASDVTVGGNRLMVDTVETRIDVEDVKSGMSASMAEMEDAGMNGFRVERITIRNQ